MTNTELKELIVEKLLPLSEGVWNDAADVWISRNAIIEHRENGDLKGAIMFHYVNGNKYHVELEGVYMRLCTDKMAFLRMFKQATQGARIIQTITQKCNEPINRVLTDIGFKRFDIDGVNVMYILERKL